MSLSNLKKKIEDEWEEEEREEKGKQKKPKILQSIYKLINYRDKQRNFDSYYEF